MRQGLDRAGHLARLGNLVRLARHLTLATMAMAVLGCSRPAVPELLAAGRVQLQGGHPQAAVIEAKNALQREPESGEARLLLGLALLEQGQAEPALIELEKAAALGQPTSAVSPPTARALLALGQHTRVIQRYADANLPPGEPAADLQTAVAAAHAAEGQLVPAAAAAEAALRMSPQYTPAVLLQARLRAAGNDPSGAQVVLDDLLAREPRNAQAWQLRGDVLVRQGASEAEVARAFRQSLLLRPDGVPAHTGLVTSLLRSGDVPAARKQVDAMRAAQPLDPLTAFVDAQVAWVEGDASRARTLSRAALRALPEHPRLLQFVGLTELQLGAPLAAEPLLVKSLQKAPDLNLTRHLLATAYLATGQPAKLETVLEPLLQRGDREALLQLAQARLQAGQPAAAQALLQRAERTPAPQRVLGSASLAAAGKADRLAGAVGALRAASAASAVSAHTAVSAGDVARTDLADGPAAERLRAEGLLLNRRFDAAAAVVQGLDTRWPAQPETAQLRGRLRLAQRDAVGARAAFEDALTRRPSYTPAVLALAALDVQAGQPALAVSRLQAALQRQPGEPGLTLALVPLLDRAGDAGPKLLADAVRLHPGEPRLRTAQSDGLQRKGQGPAALQVLQDAVVAMGGNPELLDALARQQLQERAFGQALLTLGRLRTLRPDAPEIGLRLAEAYVGLGDTAQARQALLRVQVLRPGSLPAQRGLIGVALLERQPQVALALARQVQQQRGALGVGLLLEGDVLVASGQNGPAALVYLDGVRRAPSTELAAKAHAALVANGQSAAADTLAADWRRQRPQDADFLVHLGNGALARADAAVAERHLLAAIALQPLHGLALNNLAMALLQQKRSGALPYAERAAALLPDSPEVRDTLAAARKAERPPTVAAVQPPGLLR